MLRLVPITCAAVVLAFGAGGCGDSDVSQADFQADVVAARNDADAGLEQIVQATSVEDLLERMRLAAIDVRGAASDVREAGAPEGLEDERDALAARLLALSDEIIATVDTLEAFPEQAQNTNALNFAQWNAVQAELKKLRRQGIEVRPLERHKPEIQRQ